MPPLLRAFQPQPHHLEADTLTAISVPAPDHLVPHFLLRPASLCPSPQGSAPPTPPPHAGGVIAAEDTGEEGAAGGGIARASGAAPTSKRRASCASYARARVRQRICVYTLYTHVCI